MSTRLDSLEQWIKLAQCGGAFCSGFCIWVMARVMVNPASTHIWKCWEWCEEGKQFRIFLEVEMYRSGGQQMYSVLVTMKILQMHSFLRLWCLSRFLFVLTEELGVLKIGLRSLKQWSQVLFPLYILTEFFELRTGFRILLKVDYFMVRI